jgi:pSer/pThr/pTyr-binding forkhead associated (FHA) protein
MNSSINRRELIFKALAGLLGGAIGWIPVEIVNHGHSLTQAESVWLVYGNLIVMAILAGTIGALISASDDQSFTITDAMKRRALWSFVICFVLSLPATYFSNRAFSAILAAGGWAGNHQGSIFYLIMARIVGWTLMGMMLGIGVGLATRSIRNALKGAAGGWVGGFAGGIVFDPIGMLSSSGMLSRFIGFSAVGFAIGLFIGLAHELTKTAWLVVEAGRLRGRQFRIDGPTVTIGRAEENAIGLFGDPGVQPRHAALERKGDVYTIRNLAVQAGTLVNGGRIETATLADGDQIKIGNYELRFHERAQARDGHPLAAAPPHPPVTPRPTPAAPPPSVASAAPARAIEAYLESAAGERIRLAASGRVSIGRALDNDVVIGDASVSRHHAAIEANGAGYRVIDLDSQNGSFVNGQRIAEAPLTDGAAVRFGDAAYVFHG